MYKAREKDIQKRRKRREKTVNEKTNHYTFFNFVRESIKFVLNKQKRRTMSESKQEGSKMEQTGFGFLLGFSEAEENGIFSLSVMKV